MLELKEKLRAEILAEEAAKQTNAIPTTLAPAPQAAQPQAYNAAIENVGQTGSGAAVVGSAPVSSSSANGSSGVSGSAVVGESGNSVIGAAEMKSSDSKSNLVDNSKKSQKLRIVGTGDNGANSDKSDKYPPHDPRYVTKDIAHAKRHAGKYANQEQEEPVIRKKKVIKDSYTKVDSKLADAAFLKQVERRIRMEERAKIVEAKRIKQDVSRRN